MQNKWIPPNFVYLSWDRTSASSPALLFNDDQTDTVDTMSSVGPYKNVFGNLVLGRNNIYEWRIRINKGNYFKIGIVKKSDINTIKSSFSDILSGYSYYSQGSLRHNSKSTGIIFGLPYGPGDTVNVRFNSKKGSLEFSLNNDDYKIAFEEEEFKKGGYVPAVATLIEGARYSFAYPELED